MLAYCIVQVDGFLLRSLVLFLHTQHRVWLTSWVPSLLVCALWTLEMPSLHSSGLNLRKQNGDQACSVPGMKFRKFPLVSGRAGARWQQANKIHKQDAWLGLIYVSWRNMDVCLKYMSWKCINCVPAPCLGSKSFWFVVPSALQVPLTLQALSAES